MNAIELIANEQQRMLSTNNDVGSFRSVIVCNGSRKTQPLLGGNHMDLFHRSRRRADCSFASQWKIATGRALKSKSNTRRPFDQHGEVEILVAPAETVSVLLAASANKLQHEIPSATLKSFAVSWETYDEMVSLSTAAVTHFWRSRPREPSIGRTIPKPSRNFMRYRGVSRNWISENKTSRTDTTSSKISKRNLYYCGLLSIMHIHMQARFANWNTWRYDTIRSNGMKSFKRKLFNSLKLLAVPLILKMEELKISKIPCQTD